MLAFAGTSSSCLLPVQHKTFLGSLWSLCNIFLAMTGVEFITKDPLLTRYLGRSCVPGAWLVAHDWSHLVSRFCWAEAWRYSWNCFVLLWQLAEDWHILTIWKFTAWCKKLVLHKPKSPGRTLLTLMSFIHADSINTVQLGIDRDGWLLLQTFDAKILIPH